MTGKWTQKRAAGFFFLLGALGCLVPVHAADTSSEKAETYLLRYRFLPGETLRWKVVHRGNVRTTVSGTTQTAETVSKSVKQWRVRDVRPDGTTTFVHSVESIDMWQKLTGSPEVRYNSEKDKNPPAGFTNVAKSVGKPLTIVELDSRGKILLRQRTPANTSPPTEGQLVIPLPEEPVAVGHTWSMPYDVDVRLETGGIRKVKTLQKFTLKSVKHGVATILISTQILTPLHDPAIEAQLIQCGSRGTVRFDVDAGRILGQQSDLDKRVVGFRGKASSIHYLTRLTEDFLGAEAKTAGRGKELR